MAKNNRSVPIERPFQPIGGAIVGRPAALSDFQRHFFKHADHAFVHGIRRGNRSVAALGLVSLHDVAQVLCKLLGIGAHLRSALEDCSPVVGCAFRRIFRMLPVRRNHSKHLVDLEETTVVATQIRELFVVLVEMKMEAVCPDDEREKANMQSPFRADGNETTQ